MVHAPGHARGEVIFFRESDRVAICGDVIRNMSYATGLPGIKEPPAIFTYDPAENRRSIRRLADLNPALILPGTARRSAIGAPSSVRRQPPRLDREVLPLPFEG